MVEKESKESELRFELVKVRYADHLSEEELEEVSNGVDTIVKAAEAMKAVKLENSDEPFYVFKPLERGNR
jgi:Asp-tRNA(Asn)/Glu-tRNA(Gln) amidotransferase C subunit